MIKLLIQIIDLIYSLYFCLRVFSIKEALVIPVNISHSVKIGNIHKGCIRFICPVEHNLLFLGHQGFSAIANGQGLINIESGGELILEGESRFAQGIRLWIDENVKVSIGKDFYCNKNCILRAFDNVIVGHNSLWGWNVELNTSDGHHICIDGEQKCNHGTVRIEDNVWIGSYVSIGKNALISSGSIVAKQSLVVSQFEETNVVIGGVPAKVLEKNVSWKA